MFIVQFFGNSPLGGASGEKKVLTFVRGHDIINKHSEIRSVHNAGWSSSVARRAHNPKVVGSNPAPATIFAPQF